jgi:hypothetical protein
MEKELDEGRKRTLGVIGQSLRAGNCLRRMASPRQHEGWHSETALI